MRATVLLIATTTLLVAAVGCVSVQAPERIDIGSSRSEPVDSSQVPQTSSHEEAQVELRKAYGYIRDLEQRVDKLKREKKECEREREKCEERLERYED